MDTRSTDNRYGAKAHDLGRLEDPVLVCGGAYSNLEALRALLAAAEALSIPPRRIIHTGDVIAYCADPAGTAELLRASRIHSIQGNVEQSLSVSEPDCHCGFDAGSTCDSLSAEWFAYANARIGDDLRQWMGRLPHHLTFEMAGVRARVVHGGAVQINRFLFASHPARAFAAEFSAAGAGLILAGHSGIPFTRRIGARVWHNSGSLGLPANDATPRGWFSVLTPEAQGLSIEHHALDYDFATAREKMRKAGLCRDYAETLRTGLWPSLDVLPPAEKDRTGTPLDLRPPILVRRAAPVSG